jgi:nicotinamide mononucleotide transporter
MAAGWPFRYAVAMNALLTFYGFITTPLELISFALATASVWLTIRQNAWCWLFSMLASATYCAVFFTSRLYGDAGLQLVFIAVSAWGWWSWLHPRASSRRRAAAPPAGELPVSRLEGRGRLLALAGWALGFLALWQFLGAFTDTDVPGGDGFLTAGSLVGQLLLSRKKIENWHVWIAVDILYVGLYLYKDLHVTALLYALFVVMAVAGLRTWQRDLATAAAAPATQPR